MFINGIDDRFGDKIPEPWQSLIEDMVTATYLALQDGAITDDEIDGVLATCVAVINEKVDVPFIEEADEATAFMFLLKFLATQVKIWIQKQKQE